MVRIDYIEEFLLLAETLNFSKTADMLYIAQSALSRHIAALEEEMGAKLFERDTRNVRLTPAGEVARRQFQSMMQSYQTAREQVALMATGKSGVLTLNSPYYWTEDFAEPIVIKFRERNPACDVIVRSVQPAGGFSDMFHGEGDIAISLQVQKIDDEVRRVPFATERVAVAMLAENPLAERESLRLSDLRGEQFVTLALDPQDANEQTPLMNRLFGESGIKPGTPRRTQQVDTLGLSLKQYGGVCVVPWGIRHMDRSYLRFVPLEDDDCTLTMCLYYRVDNDNPLIPGFVKTALEVGESLG